MVTIDRGQLKAAAKASIKGNVGKFFLASLVYMGIYIVAGLIPYVGQIAGILVAGPFVVGFAACALNIARKNEMQVSDIFTGFNNFGTNFCAYLLMEIFVFLWTLLLIIPGFIAAYRYSMMFYILIDKPELGAKGAIAESKKIMKGHKMDLFVLQLSFIGWYLLCMITFGIASIWVTPYVATTIANFYETIKNEGNDTAAIENKAAEPASDNQ